MTTVKRIGILAAMPQEIVKLEENVTDQVKTQKGIFSFTTGKLGGKDVVFGAANIGMVFAGSAATTMINEFGATAIVFTGVAGGLLPGQKVGDLVVGKDVVNYEMDARSFCPPWDADYKYQLGEIPIMKWCASARTRPFSSLLFSLSCVRAPCTQALLRGRSADARARYEGARARGCPSLQRPSRDRLDLP